MDFVLTEEQALMQELVRGLANDCGKRAFLGPR